MSGVYTSVFQRMMSSFEDILEEYISANVGFEGVITDNNSHEIEEFLGNQQLPIEVLPAKRDTSSESLLPIPKSKHLDLSKPKPILEASTTREVTTSQSDTNSDATITEEDLDSVADLEQTNAANTTAIYDDSPTTKVQERAASVSWSPNYKPWIDPVLKANKLKHIKELQEKLKQWIKDEPKVTKHRFISNGHDLKNVKAEFEQLKERLLLLELYLTAAQAEIHQARKGKEIGTAEPKLEVILSMVRWLMQDDILSRFHLVMGQEVALNKRAVKVNTDQDETQASLAKINLDLIETTTDLSVHLFEWMFCLQLQESKFRHHELPEREIEENAVQELLKSFSEIMSAMDHIMWPAISSAKNEDALGLSNAAVGSLKAYVASVQSELLKHNIIPLSSSWNFNPFALIIKPKATFKNSMTFFYNAIYSTSKEPLSLKMAQSIKQYEQAANGYTDDLRGIKTQRAIRNKQAQLRS